MSRTARSSAAITLPAHGASPPPRCSSEAWAPARPPSPLPAESALLLDGELVVAAGCERPVLLRGSCGGRQMQALLQVTAAGRQAQVVARWLRMAHGRRMA